MIHRVLCFFTVVRISIYFGSSPTPFPPPHPSTLHSPILFMLWGMYELWSSYVHMLYCGHITITVQCTVYAQLLTCLLLDRHEIEKQKTKLIFYYYKIIKLQKWKTNASKPSRENIGLLQYIKRHVTNKCEHKQVKQRNKRVTWNIILKNDIKNITKVLPQKLIKHISIKIF